MVMSMAHASTLVGTARESGRPLLKRGKGTFRSPPRLWAVVARVFYSTPT